MTTDFLCGNSRHVDEASRYARPTKDSHFSKAATRETVGILQFTSKEK